MIEGMNILKKTDIMELRTPTWVFVILALIIIVGVVVGIVRAISECEFGEFFFSLLISLLCCLPVYMVIMFLVPKTLTGYEYEATFDESVNLHEVYTRYEIIETKGDIYILRDIEPATSKCDCHNSHACLEIENKDSLNSESNSFNVEAEDNKASNYCNNCGQSFENIDKFCTACGTKR